MKREKYVDESWKESAAQEKERLGGGTGAGASTAKAGKEPPAAASEPYEEEGGAHDTAQPPAGSTEIDFLNYISSLGYQVMVFLGEIPNPVTNQSEKNLTQAKFVIDTLILLQEKTKGNLTKKEEDMLNMTAYELQMKYVELTQKEGIGD